MFGFFNKKKQVDERFSAPLSPEADAFLAAALEEYGQKEDALEQGWRLSQNVDFEYDDKSCTLKVSLPDGAVWEADGQILGAYNEKKEVWTWAWGDERWEQEAVQDSLIVQEKGRQLDIWYLHELPSHPMPGPEFVAYLNAIGVKATDSAGMFELHDDTGVVFLTLKNLRWSNGAV